MGEGRGAGGQRRGHGQPERGPVRARPRVTVGPSGGSRPRGPRSEAAVHADAPRSRPRAAAAVHEDPRAGLRPDRRAPGASRARSSAPNDTTPMVVINQVAPVYVSFAVPAQQLDAIRARQGRGSLEVTAHLAGNAAAASTGTRDASSTTPSIRRPTRSVSRRRFPTPIAGSGPDSSSRSRCSWRSIRTPSSRRPTPCNPASRARSSAS